MLKELLQCPQHPQQLNYQYLPVSTSYLQELETVAQQLTTQTNTRNKQPSKHDQFVANEAPENIQNELVLLKLKGFLDRRDITGKNTEIRKLPSKVQVGTMIEGEPFLASKIKVRRQDKSFADYFLRLDKEKQFTERKFSELQRISQRRKRLKKKIILKKQKQSRK